MEPTAPLVLAGVLVGLLVGLTGMGGGALLTPLLVLGFGMPPLAAVSSDLVTSLLMKPVGAAVHLRAGTVDWLLVRRLCLGAVPVAFGTAVLLGLLGTGAAVQEQLRVVTGGVLLASLAAMVASRLLRDVASTAPSPAPAWRTVAVGAVGGACVGLTSVGAGSVILALLLATQPALRVNRLVGTDLVQAVPVVAAAALGHAIFGDVRLSVAAALVVGAVPATYVGARLSARAPVGVLRDAVVVLVWTSALALVRVPPLPAVVVTGLLVVAWWVSRPTALPSGPR